MKRFFRMLLIAMVALSLFAGAVFAETPSIEDIRIDDALETLKWAPIPEWIRKLPISEVETRGYHGEVPVYHHDLNVDREQLKEIRSQGFRAAFLNWGDAAYNQAVFLGAKDALDALGIELVGVTTYTDYNVATLQRGVLNVLPLRPDLIFYSGVDPIADAEALRPALEQGVNIVAFANGPEQWVQGDPENFAALISYDTHGSGALVADAIHDRYPDGAKIGMIYFDATYKLVNEREEGFRNQLAEYPNLELVIERPMSEPNQSETIVSAMLARHPDLDVIFAPWDLCAEYAAAGLRGINRTDVKIASIDIGFTGVREMAQDGFIFVETSQLVYEWGKSGAIAGALSLIGADVPPYIISPVFAVTKDNLVEGWDYAFGGKVALPVEVKKLLDQ